MLNFRFIPKEGSLSLSSVEEFERLFQITYQPTLSFEKAIFCKQLMQLCGSGKLEKELGRRQKWLAALYAKEVIAGEIRPNLMIKWINPLLGYGVFTERDIPSHAYIGTYVGEIKRYRFWRRKGNHYCFEYASGAFKTPFFIDAAKKGGLVRFINHSDTPNVETIPLFVGGVMHIALCTTSFIPQGRQLTYDYGEDYWAHRNDPTELLN